MTKDERKNGPIFKQEDYFRILTESTTVPIFVFKDSIHTPTPPMSG